jgi:uncharacterized membrane protein
MTRKQALILGATVIIVSTIMSVWAYPQLPGTVPTHWDFSGTANGYSSPFAAVALVPAIALFTWLLMLVLPIIGPKGFGIERSAAAFYESGLAIVVVLVVMYIPILRSELTGRAPTTGLLIVPVGALMVILGNLMGKLHKNFFIGIRTPWTLANDEVWLRSNRLGDRLMVVGGSIVVVSSLLTRVAVIIILGIVVAIAIVTTVYSYVLYRSIEPLGNGHDGV